MPPRRAAMIAALLLLPGWSGVPADAVAEGSAVSTIIGDGTPASCTAAKVARAVRRGGVVRFDCGPGKVTIAMTETLRVPNTVKKLVIDGGGKVTLDGLGQRRILYQNTCEDYLTSHCQDQRWPSLVLRDLTLRRGATDGDIESGSGGALFVRGGQLRLEGTTFRANRCASTGPDTGGGAVRALDQWRDGPVRVVDSTFARGSCSNGAALSSIGVSWDIRGSVFRRNTATGYGLNPARPGTPGGGSGAAVYADGDTFDIVIRDTRMVGNRARGAGGAVFFVSNDRTGHLSLSGSLLRSNPSSEPDTVPGIFYLGDGQRPEVTTSVLR